MELSAAFGGFFPSETEQNPKVAQKSEPVVKNPEPIVQKPEPIVQKPESIVKECKSTKSNLGYGYLGVPELDPRLYMINIQISHDDTHLICVFLLVLILSVLLTKK